MKMPKGYTGKTTQIYMHTETEKGTFDRKRHSYQAKSSIKENSLFKPMPMTSNPRKKKHSEFKELLSYGALMKDCIGGKDKQMNHFGLKIQY
jgi:hypothetical protein